jgi:hypothetical protein
MVIPLNTNDGGIHEQRRAIAGRNPLNRQVIRIHKYIRARLQLRIHPAGPIELHGTGPRARHDRRLETNSPQGSTQLPDPLSHRSSRSPPRLPIDDVLNVTGICLDTSKHEPGSRLDLPRKLHRRIDGPTPRPPLPNIEVDQHPNPRAHAPRHGIERDDRGQVIGDHRNPRVPP